MRRVLLLTLVPLVVLGLSWAAADAQAAPGQFTPTGNQTDARAGGATATRLTNGKVLIAGGYSAGGVTLPSAEVYDPATQTFTATPGMSTARGLATATLLPNGKVLVTGGQQSNGFTGSSAELFDPTTGTFSLTGFMTTARQGHTATLLPNGNVLLVGGGNGQFGGNTLQSAEIYDVTTGSFSAAAVPTAARFQHTATPLPDGKVLIAGGRNGNVTLASAELYDPVAGTFAATSAMPHVRVAHTATRLANGQVLVAGGSDASQNPSQFADLYDPAAGTWTPTGGLTQTRDFHTATGLPDGRVLIVGGRGSGPGTAEVYNPTTGIFVTTGPLNFSRSQHTATLLSGGLVLVTSGSDGAVVRTTAELYDSGSPTAVKWAGGTARVAGRGVRLTWRTGREADTLGFDVLRVRRGSTKRVKVTRSLISGGAVRSRTSYRFVDRSGRRGDRYLVVARGLNGRATVHALGAAR